jgi:hypothetical protein
MGLPAGEEFAIDGFWELGCFAVAYRALFGESPSVSLQRPPDDRQISPNRPSSLANADLSRATAPVATA